MTPRVTLRCRCAARPIAAALRAYWDDDQCDYLADRLAADGYRLTRDDEPTDEAEPASDDGLPVAARYAPVPEPTVDLLAALEDSPAAARQRLQNPTQPPHPTR